MSLIFGCVQARVVSETQAGLAVAGIAHRLLDTANIIVDICLPLEKCDHIILDHGEYMAIFVLLDVVARVEDQQHIVVPERK